ncbi:hypothetical protein BJV78DRAFT_1210046 [Lactifluus subvellereus]|nr:hypothetical protein BJV78DRAFT_1210046 [Lactifluus subvellereus]
MTNDTANACPRQAEPRSMNLTSPRVTVHLEGDQKANSILIGCIANQRPLYCNGYMF